MKTLLAMSIDELKEVLERAENGNKYHGYSHTVVVSQSGNGAVYVELLSNYAECNSLTLLARK